jgi:hypothetical protein
MTASVKAFLVLLTLSAVVCIGQSDIDVKTAGMNNGCVWENGSHVEKSLYATGIADGVFLHSVVAASKIKSATPDQSLYPAGFLIADVVQGIDLFYSDRANMRVPILFSYLYVMTKIKGASQLELDAMASRFRREANQ